MDVADTIVHILISIPVYIFVGFIYIFYYLPLILILMAGWVLVYYVYNEDYKIVATSSKSYVIDFCKIKSPKVFLAIFIIPIVIIEMAGTFLRGGHPYRQGWFGVFLDWRWAFCFVWLCICAYIANRYYRNKKHDIVDITDRLEERGEYGRMYYIGGNDELPDIVGFFMFWKR